MQISVSFMNIILWLDFSLMSPPPAIFSSVIADHLIDLMAMGVGGNFNDKENKNKYISMTWGSA